MVIKKVISVINTLNSYFLLILLCLISCHNKTNKLELNNLKVNQQKSVFDDIDYIINTPTSERSLSDFVKLGKLFNNKIVEKSIKENYYAGISSYIIEVFHNNPEILYEYLSINNNVDFINYIKSEIFKYITLAQEDESENRLINNMYNNHTQRFFRYQKIINNLFPRSPKSE